MIHVDDEFKSLLARLRPVIGDEMAGAYWLGWLLQPERKQDIRAVVQALATELLDEGYSGKHILLEPPPADKAKGKYPLGTIMYAGKPCGTLFLNDGDLKQHFSAFGRSGSGKTNLGHIIVWNLLKEGKPFIVLDWRRNYSDLVHCREGKDILVFPLGETGSEASFYFNPLRPPSNLSENQRQAYQRDIISVILGTYLPGNHLLSTRGVELFMLKAIDELEKEHGKPITFDDIKYYVSDYRAVGFEKDWIVTSQNVLFKLTTGPIGRIFNSVGGMSVEDIIKRPVIFELDGLGSSSDRRCYMNTLFLWIYYYRLAEGKSRAFKHAIICEEAHNIFLKDEGKGQSPQDFMIRQMRDIGESVCILDQHISLISLPALGNTNVTICLNMKHGDDLKAAGKALALPSKDWASIGKLPTGHAIVKIQDRWPEPFLVRFPLFPLPKAQKPRCRPRETAATDSLQRATGNGHSERKDLLPPLPAPDRRGKEREGVGSKERNFLKDIAEHPLAVITERYARLGLSVHKGNDIKKGLLERKLIEQERIRVPDGAVTLLKATGKGRELLTSWGMDFKAFPHNGSLSHEFTKRRIAEEYMAKGYDVEEEYPLGGGKAIDLVCRKGGKELAIEIETGKSDVKENVRKCREAGFDEVIVVRT